jgi:alkaline phosphatase D
MRRRDFLQRTGWFVVGASLTGIPGCTDDKKNPPPVEAPTPEAQGTYSFPHGVASGDPRDSSVVVWTRAVRNSDAAAAVIVHIEVAPDPDFSTIVADRLVTATSASDHTVRVVVTQLSANTTYYYRFTAGQDSTTGRTRTAPEADEDKVQVNFAWVSCQDLSAGSFGAYRQMIIDDDARADEDKIFAVIHLGDFIYETRASDFQTAIDEAFQPISLKNADGTDRGVPQFPNGGTRSSILGTTVNFAATVDDYRLLYKTFLSDPDLQAARARWPFICIWDDHEFTDDCWQSQANYDPKKSMDEGDQARRLAASQAWFEYIPVQLTGAAGVDGVDSEAQDFTPPANKVVNAPFSFPDEDNFTEEPNNVAALGAITIYRSFRFGKHVELVMTDERSYRSDHAIPEDITSNSAFLASRNALPIDLVNQLDAGREANGGHPLQTLALGTAPNVLNIPNPRAGTPPGTMLGAKQKKWFKATMEGSDATWKLWGNEVMMMRLAIPALSQTQPPLMVSADAWDGYDTERQELMKFFVDKKIGNVVMLTGDIHASFAGQVMDNFNALPANQKVVATELVAPGIASNSLFSFFLAAATLTGNTGLLGLILADATTHGGSPVTENFNLLLTGGVNAAGAFALTHGDFTQAKPAIVATNAHVKYVDTNTQGYGYVKVSEKEVDATIVTINRPIVTPATAAGPGVKRTASFKIPADAPDQMTGPTYTGTLPFPADHS